MNNTDKSIVLIGFMGVGKTSIGKYLAEALNWEFIDTDEIIENDFNMPTSSIFKEFGENAFREKEKEVIEQISMKQHKIISVGGGAFLQKANREACLNRCRVVLLELSWLAWQERYPLIIDTRPVLQKRTMNEIQDLYNERIEIYAEHHYRITIDGLTIKQASEKILITINDGN